MKFRSALSAVRQTVRVARTSGWRYAASRVAARLSRESAPAHDQVQVSQELIVAADWTSPRPWHTVPKRSGSGPYTVAWVTSPPSPASGGHQNMFRFIKFLEEAGHRCVVSLYDWRGSSPDPHAIKAMVDSLAAYPNLDARFEVYDRAKGVGPDVDAIFATAWETAYPVFVDPSTARRLYFVQDFEPMFYATGSNSVLAENTYRFGFHGITAGRWLQAKLRDEFHMTAGSYDFAVDPSTYGPIPGAKRDGVFFYARRETPRRGFEIGAAALEEFHRIRPDVPIHLAGSAVASEAVNFPFTMHTGLTLTQLNELYNTCSAGLVISLTNMSLLPLEMVAAGVRVVMNDAPNNTMVSTNPWLRHVPASPVGMARALAELVDEPLDDSAVLKISESATSFTWDDSARQFVDAFEEAMNV